MRLLYSIFVTFASALQMFFCNFSMNSALGQFTRNYTQTVKRAADNKRRYAPGWVHSTCLLRGFPKGAAPHLAHDFAEQSVVCYTVRQFEIGRRLTCVNLCTLISNKK